MLDIEEVRARYKVARSTIYKWMRYGVFPQSVKIGSSVRWRESDLDAFDANPDNLSQAMQQEDSEIEADSKKVSWNDEDGEIAEMVKKNAELRDSRLTQIKQKVGLSENSTNYELLKRVEEMVEAIEYLGKIVKRND